MAKRSGSAGRSGKKALSKDEIISTLTAAGGNRWQKGGRDRIYFDTRNALVGLETSRYKTGNISSATFKGKAISNSEARRLIVAALDTKMYYDVATGVIHYGKSGNAKFDELLEGYVKKIRKKIS